MKFILFLFVASMQVSAAVKAQRVTLNVTDTPLLGVMKQIEKQTGYLFIYNEELLRQQPPVTLSISDNQLEGALQKLFGKYPLVYHVVGKSIVLREKPTPTPTTRAVQPQRKIRGKVTDGTGQPLAGVSIRAKGTDRVAVTGSDGTYLIEVGEGAVLLFSYLGYQTQEVNIGTSSTLDVEMKEIVGQLSGVNVVSTGFQQIPKERATGSFASVGSPQLERQISTNIIDRLEGVASGIVFNRSGSGARQIRVRGQNTIFSNAEPLIVVDNFPYEGSLDNINPNDVENITILKDASAASIWGVRAGNGVIVITTKKGRANQPLNINFNSNVTIGNKPDLYYDRAFLNSNDFINVEQQLFAAGFYTAAENSVAKAPLSPVVELLIKKRDNPSQAAVIDAQINSLRSVDYRDDLSRYFYQQNVNQQYALNLSGGADKMTYYMSGGLDQNRGIAVGSEYQRYSFNVQTTYNPVKNLEFSAGLTYVQSNNLSDNVLTRFPSYVDPYTQLADPNGIALPIVNNYRMTYVNEAPSKGFLNWAFVPLDEFGKQVTKSNNNENRLNAAAKYTFIEGLSAEVRYQYQKQMIKNNTLANSESFYTRNLVNRYSTVNTGGIVTLNNIPQGNILTFSSNEIVANNLRTQLNYNNTLGDHSFTALGGYEIREIKQTFTGGTFYGYDPNVATVTKVNTTASFNLQPNGSGAIPYTDGINNTINRYLSWYGNAAYTFKNRYTVSGSGRVDGSNYFGVKTNQKFVPLWSVGVKWDFDKESFYKLALFSKLSLRATYGYNGNLNSTLSAYTTALYLSAAPNTGLRYASITNPPNPQLRWERTRILNLGIDFGLSNKVLSGSIEYFKRNGEDIIGDAELPPSTGVSALRGNFAQTSGNGVDLTLNSNNLNGKLTWQTGLLFSYATDKVTAYDVLTSVQNIVQNGNDNSGLIYPRAGYPVYSVFSYRWAGLDPATGDPQGYENGTISKNYTNLINPSSIDDVVYSGPAKPVYSGGLQNTFSYSGFTLSVQLNFKLGYYIRQNSIYYSSLFSDGAGYADFTQRWQQPGDELRTNVPSIPSLTVNAGTRDTFYNRSEAVVQRGDHIRLQDINLSYAFTNNNLKRLGIKQLNLTLYARNLGVVWRANKQGLDPDLYTTGLYPIPTSYSLALRANF
ncbi:SusC/RagA family TonB-linked outer membrane protein [Pedobacter sp.]